LPGASFEDVMTQPTGNDDRRVITAINQAIGLEATGQRSKAIETLEGLVSELPGVAAARAYLAWYYMETGRHDESILQSQKAVELATESERVSLVHFHVLWAAGHHAAAIDEMKRFTERHRSEDYTEILKELEDDVNP
jgi:predicted Zn-dependent protease